MATGGEYHWRETYFILFDSKNRPTISQIERALGDLGDRFELSLPAADAEGRFESITVASPPDHVALEISYECGEAVIEQGTELAKQLKGEAQSEQLAKLLRADARLDVMHFEHVTENSWAEDNGDEDLDDLIDPSCLLLVVDALVELCRGIPIDPASGAILP